MNRGQNSRFDFIFNVQFILIHLIHYLSYLHECTLNEFFNWDHIDDIFNQSKSRRF